MGKAERRKIAIVDDDYAVRDSLRFLLEVLGYSVQAFASASEFLKAEIQQFACLVLDHHMPHLTGLELAEWLRTSGVHIPILLVIGSPAPAIAARAVEVSVDRVLETPPGEHELLDFIETTLP